MDPTNSKEAAECRETRHPTETKSRFPTSTPPLISIGTKDLALLRYMLNRPGERLNIKSYSREMAVPRSSVYECLNRLIIKQYISKECTGVHILSSQGKSAAEMLSGGVGNPRRECRESALNLSTHFLKFTMQVTDRSRFRPELLKFHFNGEVRENRLHNLHQYIVRLDDTVIIINPHTVIINVHDFISGDVDEATIETTGKAIKLINTLSELGLQMPGAMIESGHYARIESHLSDFLYKLDNRYYLDLGDGKKFWIDHSVQREDETNDKLVRDRVDAFLSDMVGSTAIVSDIDKLLQVTANLVKLECMKVGPVHLPMQPLEFTRPDYVG